MLMVKTKTKQQKYLPESQTWKLKSTNLFERFSGFSGLSYFWNQNPKGKKPLVIKKKDGRWDNCGNRGEFTAGYYW